MNLDIMKIKESLRNTQKSESTLIKSNDSSIETGQIWSVKNKNKNINTYLFCITEVLDDNKINVNAIFRWTELAGSDDLKLPANFIGSRAVYSFEISATVAINELDTCIGKFSDDSLAYIANAEKDFYKSLNRPPFNWGGAYIDEYDVRYKYHKDIIENIEKMQSKLYPDIFETKINKKILIPFPRQKYAIAAAGEIDVVDNIYGIEDYPLLTLIVSEVANSNLCNFNFYENNDISTKLAGADIYDLNDNIIAQVANNCAEFAKEKIADGCYLKDKNGMILQVIEKNIKAK